ncbi:MAG: Gx transporter family protein [Clostridia bacterium]|nr:Gx transporter family protein [Clostridia bacterium]
MMDSKAYKVAKGAMLGALAVAVSAAESLLPTAPFLPPGAKLGLSNVVTMYISRSVGLGYGLAAALLKSLFVLATRGLTAFLMSLAGGLLSTLVCGLLLTKEKAKIGYIGVGVTGALLHNSAQLCVSIALAGTAVAYYAPFLIAASLVTGSLGGALLGLIIKRFPKNNVRKDQ